MRAPRFRDRFKTKMTSLVEGGREGKSGRFAVAVALSRRLQQRFPRTVVKSYPRKIARCSRARRSFINVPVRRFPPGYQLFVAVK